MPRKALNWMRPGNMFRRAVKKPPRSIYMSAAIVGGVGGVVGLNPFSPSTGFVTGGVLGAAQSNIDLLYGVPGAGQGVSRQVAYNEWQRRRGTPATRAEMAKIDRRSRGGGLDSATGDLVLAMHTVGRR